MGIKPTALHNVTDAKIQATHEKGSHLANENGECHAGCTRLLETRAASDTSVKTVANVETERDAITMFVNVEQG